MKIFIIILFVLSLVIIGFNIYLIDFSNPFEGRSFVALISAGVAGIALLLLLAFYLSRRIKEKLK
ncbi:hypothetical protein [Capnocytophaga cynodegmi]|uniref:Uncharacterized protein n=1 Tax=Capnocytophaga cynodegmi TaxID=28189 RepID=A0A0B7HD45_9FLAO|nr:hypothetical protein [Capnocytophaga cynodegmi]ATA67393.1 hypothetical protein CGC48_01385 [Capnocytophaga cynodegmi]CEN35503.1 conserved hypothetical protein [Capnocytophaga cynodegmi]CEN39473.1 conserved hypothetical protein [Capnocytophaga cynodegmi]CEN40066.1 conserved hypothetical protein [Capnocytophaga cynodegmi]GIM51768.1 hypothetical protein CAPN004_07980 [Capnocytophaga cynodegmi]